MTRTEAIDWVKGLSIDMASRTCLEESDWQSEKDDLRAALLALGCTEEEVNAA